MIRNDKLLDIFSCRDIDAFFVFTDNFLKDLKFENYVLIKFNEQIGEPVYADEPFKDFVADAVDLGFRGDYETNGSVKFEYFGKQFEFPKVFFLTSNKLLIGAICLVRLPDNEKLDHLRSLVPHFAGRAYEILVEEKRTDIYVDYQKKIDFIKNASAIFKNIKVDDVLSTGVAVLMNLFSAEASVLFYKDSSHSIGVKKEDFKNIRLNGKNIEEFCSGIRGTEFFTEGFNSEKYNISNIFVVYEEKFELKIILFNVHVDFVPDKEFGEMVTNIVSIAMENALSHEKALEIKLNEAEMQKTGEILNVFSNRELKIDEPVKFYGVSLPAKNAGGDFLGVSNIGDKIFICVADVCGKGYSAAVLTVVINTFTDFLTGTEGTNLSLEHICNRLSKFIISKNLEGRFITSFFGLYDIKKMELEYISAGHEPMYLIKKGDIVPLISNYLPMGILNENYKSETVSIEKGDRCFFYTDGVVEYIDYEEIKHKLLTKMDPSIEHFIKSLYNSCVKDTKNQLDDFTCGLMVF